MRSLQASLPQIKDMLKYSAVKCEDSITQGEYSNACVSRRYKARHTAKDCTERYEFKGRSMSRQTKKKKVSDYYKYKGTERNRELKEYIMVLGCP